MSGIIWIFNSEFKFTSNCCNYTFVWRICNPHTFLFYSNKLLEDDLEKVQIEYPRVNFIEDKNGVLLNVLQRNSSINFNYENPIFVIDPYGRAVMYFEPGMDPKLILKDLKVLI